MQAGTLNTPITLQTKTTTTDNSGEKLETWGSPLTLRARVSDRIATTDERFSQAADQEQARVRVQVTIRYRAGLSPALNRLIIDGVVHDILAVLKPEGSLGTGRHLTLLCERIAR
jgi:SPP1 family predicted phage head-tail adaptor